MPVTPNMIDREDFLAEFHQMMQPGSNIRVIRLLGEGKMGKSHLLTKVLPKIIEENYEDYRHLAIDMRREAFSVPDYLHLISSLLSLPFPDFMQAYQDWLNRPKINVLGLKAVLAKVAISSRDGKDDAGRFVPAMTKAFADDLRRSDDKRIIFLFDAVEQANKSAQDWLMDMLLVHLTRLEHVRVIVAGRTLPDANGSYAVRCGHFELRPVEEEQAYIDYCHIHAPALQIDQISILARAFDYRPGAFAEVLSKVTEGGGSHV